MVETVDQIVAAISRVLGPSPAYLNDGQRRLLALELWDDLTAPHLDTPLAHLKRVRELAVEQLAGR